MYHHIGSCQNHIFALIPGWMFFMIPVGCYFLPVFYYHHQLFVRQGHCSIHTSGLQLAGFFISQRYFFLRSPLVYDFPVSRNFYSPHFPPSPTPCVLPGDTPHHFATRRFAGSLNPSTGCLTIYFSIICVNNFVDCGHGWVNGLTVFAGWQDGI